MHLSKHLSETIDQPLCPQTAVMLVKFVSLIYNIPPYLSKAVTSMRDLPTGWR